MSVRCNLGFHRSSNHYFTVRNGVTLFGECPRCLIPIIKHDGKKWQEVPKGYRVVWRRRSECELA